MPIEADDDFYLDKYDFTVTDYFVMGSRSGNPDIQRAENTLAQMLANIDSSRLTDQAHQLSLVIAAQPDVFSVFCPQDVLDFIRQRNLENIPSVEDEQKALAELIRAFNGEIDQ